jgi:hypothetical protein
MIVSIMRCWNKPEPGNETLLSYKNIVNILLTGHDKRVGEETSR